MGSADASAVIRASDSTAMRGCFMVVSSIRAICPLGVAPCRNASTEARRCQNPADLRRLDDAQRVERDAMAVAEYLADAATVADVPIGLVADEAGRRGSGDGGELLQRMLGLGSGELVVDD